MILANVQEKHNLLDIEMIEINDPPIPATVDLRRYPTLPIDVQRLRDSDFVALASADEFRAALLLLSAAWHQVPAGSLPTDDRLLCALAKVEMKTWKKIKHGALRGFAEHSDKRLYHPVLTATVLKSWDTMRTQKGRTVAATAARKDRHGQRDEARDEARDVHQMKGKERNINGTPPPQDGGESGGGDFEKKGDGGLGDMLAELPGFADPALIDSLNRAAQGASADQLARAVEVIRQGGEEIKNREAWVLAIARRAALGQVTIQKLPIAEKEIEESPASVCITNEHLTGVLHSPAGARGLARGGYKGQLADPVTSTLFSLAQSASMWLQLSNGELTLHP